MAEKSLLEKSIAFAVACFAWPEIVTPLIPALMSPLSSDAEMTPPALIPQAPQLLPERLTDPAEPEFTSSAFMSSATARKVVAETLAVMVPPR